jgi:D-lyxose ketol-isomerase
MINEVKKVWGNERWLINNDKYCSKFLNLNNGYTCSLHYHAIKDETFYVLCGTVEIKYVDLRKVIPVLSVILNAEEIEDIYKTAIKNKDLIEKNIKIITLNHGEQFRIKPFVAHSFIASSFAAQLLEVSTTHFEEDSYRLTESRKLNKGE